MEDMRDNDQGPHRMKIERTTKELKKGKMAIGMKASQGLFNRKVKKLDQSRLKKLMKMMHLIRRMNYYMPNSFPGLDLILLSILVL